MLQSLVLSEVRYYGHVHSMHARDHAVDIGADRLLIVLLCREAEAHGAAAVARANGGTIGVALARVKAVPIGRATCEKCLCAAGNLRRRRGRWLRCQGWWLCWQANRSPSQQSQERDHKDLVGDHSPPGTCEGKVAQ